MNDAGSQQFGMLRTLVESALKRPCVVVVTAAQVHDGSSVTAFGLADRLVGAGHRTAFVNANEESQYANEPPSSEEPRRDLAMLSMPTQNTAGSSSGHATRSFIDRMRSQYDFTVISAEPLFSSGMAMALAREADAVLVSLRIGRKPCEEDDLTARALRIAGANVLGVVGVSGSCVGDAAGGGQRWTVPAWRTALLEQCDDDDRAPRTAISGLPSLKRL